MILNVISDKEIEELREEAQKNGDLDRVKICDLALNGNEAANILCARTLFDEQEKSLDSLGKRKAALADFEKQYHDRACASTIRKPSAFVDAFNRLVEVVAIAFDLKTP
jgi:hypothetical protein